MYRRAVGGSVDPDTGELVWDFHVPIAEQAAVYAAHPPSALGTLRATAIELPDHAFDGHGEPVNVAFAVACPCGSTLFVPTGYWSDDEDRFISPITLECAGCETWHEIFDSSRHGFDGAVGNNRAREPGPDEVPDELAGPSEILVRFEFPSDHLGALATLFDDECA